MKKIKEINSVETFAVRHPVLREGKPVESCVFDGDDWITTKHFGLFIDEKLTAVVSVFQNNRSNFKAQNQFQMRGMAVLPEHQKKGLGELLVLHCEQYVTSQNGGLIWFNARQNAVGFYERLGYRKFGNPFNIEGVGVHYIMSKEIGK